ncbi:MAG: 2-oxo acid dehydrogenase subunit E2 [Prolixibacteraceae bacterium]|nr:2-oxo acid dehydrogenase subunit E2 [Prolixibacteraceae bacterium]
MPRQGQSVESCILTEIYKKKGDNVAVGDLLFAYETDKASFEEESRFEGIVLDVFYAEGDEVPVLTNVMVIGSEGESVEGLKPDEVKSAGVEPASGVADNNETKARNNFEQTTFEQGEKKILKVSPLAKNIAGQHHIDPGLLSGSGPNGRVIARDIRKVIEDSLQKKQGTAPENRENVHEKIIEIGDDFETAPLTNIRKRIARAMHESLLNSAQLTHHLGADARTILALRKKVKEGVKIGSSSDITLNDMVCFAAITALKKFPNVNAHFLSDNMKKYNKVHLGIAVDTERGLMVPVIKRACELSVQGLSERMKDLAAACRKGSVDPDLLAPEAASFTVSNLGNYGVEMFTPVINLPQVAILGVNTIVPRPKQLDDGAYAFVPFIGLSLTYDHRAIDGGEATRFLKQVAIEIENLEIK